MDSSNKNNAAPLPELADPFYPPPAWACLPSSSNNNNSNNNNTSSSSDTEWTLIEIKGGTEVSKLHLSQRPSWLIGRAADQVHIPLAHPSISRCHARIAFDASGRPWLRDLQSTHGVVCNKKPLPPAAIGKVETSSTKTGSRGVMLFPGDVLQFGASTRLYCLEGPAAFQRGSIRIPNTQVKAAPTIATPIDDGDPQANDSTEHEEQEEDTGVSWGMSMDEAADHNNEGDDEHPDAILVRQQALENGSNIPDKHRKAWEKIAALKCKLKNVLVESERIRRKGDLSTGQEHQLQRNQQRETELQEKIVERERDLYDKLHPEKASNASGKRRKRHHLAADDDDDVDDFFDRTKDNNNNKDDQQGDGETEESLLAKWNDVKGKLRGITVASERGSQKVTRLQQRLDRLQASGDDEAFFAQNDLDLAQDQYQKILTDKDKMDLEMQEAKRLLKIVNPKLVLVEQDEAAPSSSSSSMMAPPPPGRKMMMDSSADTNATVVMPPPSFRPSSHGDQTAEGNATNSQSNKSCSDGGNGFMMPPPMMPPPKRKRTLEPSPQLPPDVDTESKETMPSPVSTSSGRSKGKVKGPSRPVMGTLAALTAVSSSGVGKQSAINSNHDESASQHQHKATKKKDKQATTIDMKKDEWQAPKDQDGSGMTKLNAKFAGRY